MIFEKINCEGNLYKYPMKKYIKDGKVLPNLGLKSKVFLGPLTTLCAWGDLYFDI
jgi:hypothetical protein